MVSFHADTKRERRHQCLAWAVARPFAREARWQARGAVEGSGGDGPGHDHDGQPGEAGLPREVFAVLAAPALLTARDAAQA